MLWPSDAKSWLIWKDPNAGKDWGWEHQFSREGEDRGWDGWMASLTRWTWVWVDSGSWWWTGRPGVLQFMGCQRVRHDWATELNWIELKMYRIVIWVTYIHTYIMKWWSQYVCIYIYFQILNLYRVQKLLQNIDYGFFCCTVGPCSIQLLSCCLLEIQEIQSSPGFWQKVSEVVCSQPWKTLGA